MEATPVRLGAVTGLLEPCGLNGRRSFGEIERTRNMMMIPVQVIAFFIAAMVIPADVREFTIELQGKNTSTNTFVFHHLRELENKPSFNRPGLVTFDAKDKKRFLLFLKRESDGRYAPLTGQTDPDAGVKDLGTYP